MRLFLYVGLRSAHVEHQLGIVRAHSLENAVQRIRVARERVQLRLRETDELQKRNFSVHRLDRGDGRVADDGQPRDGRVQLREGFENILTSIKEPLNNSIDFLRGPNKSSFFVNQHRF